MWVFLSSRGETSACTATRGADWTVWIGSWLGDETTRNQMMPHLTFKRFLKSNVTCDLGDRIMIFLYCAITLSLPLKRMPYCLKSGHSLRFYLVFPHVIACFALGLLQLLFTVATAVFMSVMCFLELWSCPALTWLWFIWVHRVPNTCAVNDQFPCIVVIASAIQMAFQLPLVSRMHWVRFQVELHRLQATAETISTSLLLGYRDVVRLKLLKPVLQTRAQSL